MNTRRLIKRIKPIQEEPGMNPQQTTHDDDMEQTGGQENAIEIAQVVPDHDVMVDGDDNGTDDEEFDDQDASDQHQTISLSLTRQTAGLESLEGLANVKIIKVVPLPHARSEVWSYFGFLANDEGNIEDKRKAICKICATTLSYSGNTTNLFTHLKAMHPEANPQKLAPTNRNPNKSKRGNRRHIYSILQDGSILDASTGSNVNSDSKVLIRTPSVVNTQTPNGSVKDVSGEEETGEADPLSSTTPAGNVISSDDVTDAIVDLLVKDCRPISLTEGKGFQSLITLLAPNYRLPDPHSMQVLLKRKYEHLRKEFILKGMSEENEWTKLS